MGEVEWKWIARYGIERLNGTKNFLGWVRVSISSCGGPLRKLHNSWRATVVHWFPHGREKRQDQLAIPLLATNFRIEKTPAILLHRWPWNCPLNSHIPILKLVSLFSKVPLLVGLWIAIIFLSFLCVEFPLSLFGFSWSILRSHSEPDFLSGLTYGATVYFPLLSFTILASSSVLYLVSVTAPLDTNTILSLV